MWNINTYKLISTVSDVTLQSMDRGNSEEIKNLQLLFRSMLHCFKRGNTSKVYIVCDKMLISRM